MLLGYAGISQTSKPDTLLPIPVTQLKKAITLIEQGKVCRDEVQILKTQNAILENQVSTKDSIITRYKKNESDYRVSIKYYKDMNVNYEEIIDNLDENIKIHQKFIKKQKFNRYLYALGGLAVGFFILK